MFVRFSFVLACNMSNSIIFFFQSVPPVEDVSVVPKETSLSEDDKLLLNIYHSNFNDDNIDMDLLLNLLIQIHCTQPRGLLNHTHVYAPKNTLN